MNFWHIILTVLMLSVLILLHELGHFIAARIFKVPVNEFAIGMGPKLLSYKSKKTGTVYALRLFPIGGFVSMVGEDKDCEDENALFKKPVWQRMIITAAGAFMNILTGFIVMAIIVISSPRLAGTTVAQFAEGALTQNSGLMVGDEILKIDGDSVHVAGDLSYEIMHDAVNPVDLVVRRNGEVITLKDVEFPVVYESGVAFGQPDFSVYPEEKTFLNIINHTFWRSVSNVKMVWETLIDLVGGKYGIEHVSGPIGVTTAVSQTASQGVDSFLSLVVMIAMNLGVVNLLPLPALDGGRLLFQFIELIRRKPLKPQVEGYVHFVGIVLLLILMVVIAVKDVFTLIG